MANTIQILKRLDPRSLEFAMQSKFIKRAMKVYENSVKTLGSSRPQKLLVPLVLIWHLTNKCNLRCTYCYSDSNNRNEEELDKQQKLELVDQFARMGLPSLQFSGGESILSPDFWQVAEKSSRSGIKTGLFTNGTTLNYDNIQRLKSIGIGEVSVSLDTLRQGKDRRFKSYYVPQVLDSIQDLRNAKIPTLLIVTLTKSNLSELEDIIKCGEELGVEEIDLFPYKAVGRGLGEEETLSQEDFDYILKVGTELLNSRKDVFYTMPDAKFSREVLLSDCNPPNSHAKIYKLASEYLGGCMAGTLYCSILPDGRVTPCPLIPDVIVGDVKETPIQEIWQKSPVLTKLRNRDLEGKCGDCDNKSICGGCRSAAYYINGDLFGDDPYCRIEVSSEK